MMTPALPQFQCDALTSRPLLENATADSFENVAALPGRQPASDLKCLTSGSYGSFDLRRLGGVPLWLE
jgi:hypothetical protein